MAGFDTDTGVLSYPFVKIGHGRQGDLEKALGVSNVKSEIKLIGDLDNNGNRANRTNIWAKHKSFRNSTFLFPFDKTKLTPETRSPERCAAALAAHFGLSIPRFGGIDFKTHYADPWTYLPPRGTNSERFRSFDFDGYQKYVHWFDNGSTDKFIQTIFNGGLSAPSTRVSAGDRLNFYIQCADDPDAGQPGLLYPYSFAGAPIDLSQYYMGIALLDSSSPSQLFVITGERMNVHHSMYDIDASMYANIPNAVRDGALIAIPVLVEHSTGGNWETAGAVYGYLVSLHGAYLSLNKIPASENLDINVVITVDATNSTLTMVFTIENTTGHDVQLNNLYGYILSGASDFNEPDDPQSPIPIRDPSTVAYIWNNWPNIIETTPPFLTNPPEIYLSDRDRNTVWPSYPYALCARAYTTAYNDFRAANPNTSDTRVIRTGATVTWTKVFDYSNDPLGRGFGDDYGRYDDTYAALELCVSVNPNVNYVRDFYSYSQE